METTIDVYAIDDVKDNKATPINIISSITMDNMGNLTLDLERSKDIVFLEGFKTWFYTNGMSITMICIVGLVLIALIIIFTCKVIHKRYSQKHIYQCPNNILPEPAHYEVISNIVV